MSVSTELNRIITAKEDIRQAIISKGVAVDSAATIDTYATAVSNIQTGGGGASDDVRFFDGFEGKVLYQYSKQDFLALTSMPANPTGITIDRFGRLPLTPNGWNWSLADAKAYVTKYGGLDVGQIYDTTDGACYLYITIPDGSSPTIKLLVSVSISGTVGEVDWGDNTTTSEFSSVSQVTTLTHTYNTEGMMTSYVIKISKKSGSGVTIIGPASYVYGDCLFGNTGNTVDNIGRFYLDYALIGSVSSPAEGAFQGTSIKCITLNNVSAIGNYLFYNAFQLKHLTIPSSVTFVYTDSIANKKSGYSAELKSISIPNRPTQVNGFPGMNKLERLFIPETTTSGIITINNINNLKKCIIPDIFNGTFTCDNHGLDLYLGGAKSITLNYFNYNLTVPANTTGVTLTYYTGDVLRFNSSATTISKISSSVIDSFTIPSSVKTIGEKAFSGSTISEITIPSGVTSLGKGAFMSCENLKSIVFENNDVPSGCCSACTSLAYVSIPSGVTSIGAAAFSGCTNLMTMYVYADTPPTIANANSIPKNTGMVIYIPSDSLSTYQSANIWSGYSSYFVEME